MMRPFLKWAGGKYSLTPLLKRYLPAGKRLVEPFVGSGAVFLNTDYPNYLLTDANKDLISLYHILQQQGEPFIEHCKQHFHAATNRADYFYHMRQKFNQIKDNQDKAALFVYLNRHGYNGLCRYNSTGGFNVPFGAYVNPQLPEAKMRHFHAKAQQAQFHKMDFLKTMQQAQAGDVVYCDPPYVPLNATARFTAYQALRFTNKEQCQLAQAAEELANRDIPVIISNHDTKWTRELYKNAHIISFDAPRRISCNGQSRHKVAELLAIFTKKR
jgi:DNA adenine methylase